MQMKPCMKPRNKVRTDMLSDKLTQEKWLRHAMSFAHISIVL